MDFPHSRLIVAAFHFFFHSHFTRRISILISELEHAYFTPAFNSFPNLPPSQPVIHILTLRRYFKETILLWFFSVIASRLLWWCTDVLLRIGKTWYKKDINKTVYAITSRMLFCNVYECTSIIWKGNTNKPNGLEPVASWTWTVLCTKSGNNNVSGLLMHQWRKID